MGGFGVIGAKYSGTPYTYADIIAYYVYDIGAFLVGYQCYYCAIGGTIGRGLSSIWILGCCNV